MQTRKRLALVAVLAALGSTPSFAQTDTQIRNAISDSARAQRDQANSLRSIERYEREAARDRQEARQNAERDSRSMRRFDR